MLVCVMLSSISSRKNDLDWPSGVLCFAIGSRWHFFNVSQARLVFDGCMMHQHYIRAERSKCGKSCVNGKTTHESLTHSALY